MKNKKLLVALALLLKLDQNVLLAAADKEDGDESLVKGFTDKHTPYTVDELGTLIKNGQKQYLEKADFDINEVPKPLYSKIAAAVLESKEKAIAKEYGVDKYDGLQDLLAKAIESKTGKGVDEQSKQQIETLKKRVSDLELEKVDELKKVDEKYQTEFTSRDFSAALTGLPLKADKEVIENKRKLLSSAFNAEMKVSRLNEKTVVIGKDGKVITNKVGDPEELSNVLKSFAAGYGFEFVEADPGGRGGEGSDPQTGASLKGLSFAKALEVKEAKPNTAEADAVFKEWSDANPK